MGDSEKTLTYADAEQMCMKAFDGGIEYGESCVRYGVNAVAYDWEHWREKNKRMFMPPPTAVDINSQDTTQHELDTTQHELDTTQHELDTTQRELNAATYYTWEAIKRITDALIYLKWLVDGGKDEERAARKLDGFSKSIRDIAAIRTKFYQEQLRIVMDDAVSTMADSGDD